MRSVNHPDHLRTTGQYRQQARPGSHRLRGETPTAASAQKTEDSSKIGVGSALLPLGVRFGLSASRVAVEVGNGDPTTCPMHARTRNFLRGHGITSWNALLALSEAQLLGYRQGSQAVVDDLVRIIESVEQVNKRADERAAAPSRPHRGSRSTTPAPTPDRTRRCFLHKGLWWFRVDVDREVLRGSGRKVPVGAVNLFQVHKGTRSRFAVTNASGNLHEWVTISWEARQPEMGSIRRISRQLEATESDALWFTPLPAPGTIAVRLTRRVGSTADGIARARFLCGVSAADQRTATVDLAIALGLPPTNSLENVAIAARSRGDADVAIALEEHLNSTIGKNGYDFEDFSELLAGKRPGW